MNVLPASTRRAQILDRIRRDGGVTIAELARSHAISNMTAHRDLEQLAAEGLVERVRGGARALPAAGARATHPTAWGHRIGQAADAKAAIAAEAATLVASGSTVFLDASSTALALAAVLAAAPPYELTLVTNSPMIAGELRADSIHVVVCPGELDQHTRTITGRWTVEFIRRLNFDTAFVSAAGITLDTGLTTSRSPIAEVLKAATDVAGRTIGMVDATKFGRASLVSILPARRARPADQRCRAGGRRRGRVPRRGRRVDARAGLTASAGRNCGIDRRPGARHQRSTLPGSGGVRCVVVALRPQRVKQAQDSLRWFGSRRAATKRVLKRGSRRPTRRRSAPA